MIFALLSSIASAESVTILSSSSSLTKRIIKKFDFNERPLGNLEDVPMYWAKVQAPGFPHFVNGKFDEQTGVPAPSFKLQLNGGNLGYVFTARKISAFPGSDHKIIAKVKTANMKYARGYIEAFYLDRFGNPLKDTIKYSQLIAPTKSLTQKWQTIVINLPFTNPAGRFIGLGVFLVQPDHLPDIFNTQITSYKKDIYAAMWIDEISIIRLPQAKIKLKKNNLIYDSSENITVYSLIADPTPDDLSARIILSDNATTKSVQWQVPVEILPPIEAILQGRASRPAFTSFELGKLQAGLYTLNLQVLANNQIIVSKKFDFAVLNHNRPTDFENNLGIDLSGKPIDRPALIMDFISKLKPGWALIPFWRRDFSTVTAHSDHSPADILATGCKHNDIKVLGGFLEIPKNLKLKEKLISPSIWDLFASNNAIWKIPLASLLARQADKIDTWIFGEINDYWQSPDSRIASLLSQLKKYFSQFQGRPIFAAAWPALRNPPTKKIADNYFVKIPVELVPSSFENYFIQWKQVNTNPIITLQTLPLDKYKIIPATQDFVRRLIETKKNGITLLACGNLWSNNNKIVSAGMMPNAYYAAFANIIDRLGGTHYLGQIEFAPGQKGILFGNSQHAVLVIVQMKHKAKFLEGEISLGDNLIAYDMWGRKLPIIYNENKWILPYQQIVFIDGITPELANFISTIRFAQPNLTSKFGVHKIKLTFRNTFAQTINGTVRVKASRFWRFDPSGARFTLIPGGKFVLPMKLRFPSNEPIGQKIINVKFDIEARKVVHLNLLIPLGVSSSDLKMRVLWFMRDDKLVIIQEIRNYGKIYADLQAFLIAPNRPRMERQIRKLAPGQFAIKEYTVGPWRQMFGRKIRVGFREIRGTRMVNQIITIE